MITSKQRSKLKGLANRMNTIFQVGKSGLSDQLVAQVSDALRARELIKMRALETSPLSSREAAEALAKACGAEVVQVIGSKFILYKRNPEEPVIEL